MNSFAVDFPRYLRSSHAYGNSIELSYVFKVNEIPGTYDPGGLAMENPDAGEDLLLAQAVVAHHGQVGHGHDRRGQS